MPDPRHYYDILELEMDAPLDAVKEAYRDLAQVWHPDRFANSPRLQQKAQEKMKEINEAYDYLKTYRPAPRQTTPPRSSAQRAARPDPPTYRPGSARPATEHARSSTQNLPDEVWCMRGHTALVSSVAFSPSSKLVLSGGYDKTVRVWQIGTGLEKTWFLGHKSAITSVAFAPDNRGVLSGGMDKSILMRDCETKKELHYFYAGAVVECIAISPDGRYVLSGTVGSGTILWEVSSDRELRRFNVGGFVSCVCFSPRGNRVVIGTSDGDVALFDRIDGSEAVKFRVMRNGSGQMIHTVRFSRDGSYVLTASTHQLQMWQASTGRETGRLETGPSGLTCADIAPDGTRVVTGHSDFSVRLWSLSIGKECHMYKGHTEAVKTVAFSPDGQLLASGSFDKSVRIWRVKE